MTLFIGWLGAVALAAHGVLFQYLALTFMVAYGIAGATQVRVGNAWGRGDPRGMAAAGWTGLGLAVALTGAALLYLACPEASLAVFTDDPAVIAGALPVFLWMTLALVFDGGQTVMSNACRGRGDTWVPTALHFGSYWLVMVPAAWAFAFAPGTASPGSTRASPWRAWSRSASSRCASPPHPRNAVTSISTFISGRSSRLTTVVLAGRTAPNAALSAGPIAGWSAGSVT
jgi:Na+-driven multidrug efflux pump